MDEEKRSIYELKKLAELWIDLAKIALASMVIKLFEPEVKITFGSLIFALGGLITFLVCARIGLDFARKVKNNEANIH